MLAVAIIPRFGNLSDDFNGTLAVHSHSATGFVGTFNGTNQHFLPDLIVRCASGRSYNPVLHWSRRSVRSGIVGSAESDAFLYAKGW
jgi:hypothetical protein